MAGLYFTGDIHGDVSDLKMRIQKANVPVGSYILLAGDTGLNYYLDSSDAKRKQQLSEMPYTFLSIYGNHEARPWEVPNYIKVDGVQDVDGAIYYQKKYANILFLDDGLHQFGGREILVLGGAYSVDKNYRLATGSKWWESEQMAPERRKFFLDTFNKTQFDIIVSHTCPYWARPLEKGLTFVDQSTVDSSMEVFLEQFRLQNYYDFWFCGHWHIDEKRDDGHGEIHFLHKEIVQL